MLREKIVYVQATVRGFHFYKSIWAPTESEVLSCEYEENSPHELFAIKTCQESGRIVIYLPMEISRIIKYFLNRGARIEAKLKVHQCRFEKLPICLCSYKNNTLKFLHFSS